MTCLNPKPVEVTTLSDLEENHIQVIACIPHTMEKFKPYPVTLEGMNFTVVKNDSNHVLVGFRADCPGKPYREMLSLENYEGRDEFLKTADEYHKAVDDYISKLPSVDKLFQSGYVNNKERVDRFVRLTSVDIDSVRAMFVESGLPFDEFLDKVELEFEVYGGYRFGPKP